MVSSAINQVAKQLCNLQYNANLANLKLYDCDNIKILAIADCELYVDPTTRIATNTSGASLLPSSSCISIMKNNTIMKLQGGKKRIFIALEKEFCNINTGGTENEIFFLFLCKYYSHKAIDEDFSTFESAKGEGGGGLFQTKSGSYMLTYKNIKVTTEEQQDNRKKKKNNKSNATFILTPCTNINTSSTTNDSISGTIKSRRKKNNQFKLKVIHGKNILSKSNVDQVQNYLLNCMYGQGVKVNSTKLNMQEMGNK